MIKAVVYEKHGSPDVLELQGMGKPTPKANQASLKIYATTVTEVDFI